MAALAASCGQAPPAEYRVGRGSLCPHWARFFLSQTTHKNVICTMDRLYSPTFLCVARPHPRPGCPGPRGHEGSHGLKGPRAQGTGPRGPRDQWAQRVPWAQGSKGPRDQWAQRAPQAWTKSEVTIRTSLTQRGAKVTSELRRGQNCKKMIRAQ